MSLDLIVISVVLLFIIVSFYTEKIGPALTFFIGIIVLGLFRILSPKEILSGLANEQIAVIILLLLLGDTMRKSDLIDRLFDRVFRNTTTYKGFLSRMTFLVAGFSAFMNNTPLVAIMMPYSHSWGKRNHIKPSKLLIPLSYATILGGCATLIGTSTNLIINGMVTDQQLIPGLKPLGLFDFTPAGLPMILLGSLYLIFFSDKLLPSREDVISDFSKRSREYLVDAGIRARSPIIGKTIEEAGLRSLPGLYLVEVSRGSIGFPAVPPDLVLQEGDILTFAGDTANIAEMISANNGLTLTEVGMYHRKKHADILELIISHNSTLINKTVKEANFRGRHDAAILSIHRNGEKLSGRIGDVKLRAGDVLLVMTGTDFMKRGTDTHEFYLLSHVRELRRMKWYQNLALFGGTALAIATSALGFISLFMALLLVMILILALRISSPKDISKSIDYNLAIIIVLALALGTAMIKTGMADLVAKYVVGLVLPLGGIGLLAGIFIITNLLASYITTKAAAAIIFPIAVTAAMQMGLPTTPYILMVAYGAAANFITPIGYQTNLMVYGPGRYKFRDYMKIGLPITLIYLVVSVTVLSFWYKLY